MTHPDAGALLPCPFCGTAPVLINGTENEVGYFIRCEYCRLDYPQAVLNTPEKAIAIWNDRQAASQGSAGGEGSAVQSGEPVAWIFEAREKNDWRPRVSRGKPILNDEVRNVEPLFTGAAQASPDYRQELENARQEIVLAIAFLGRDIATKRLDITATQLCTRLANADARIRGALALPSAQCGGGK